MAILTHTPTPHGGTDVPRTATKGLTASAPARTGRHRILGRAGGSDLPPEPAVRPAHDPAVRATNLTSTSFVDHPGSPAAAEPGRYDAIEAVA